MRVDTMRRIDYWAGRPLAALLTGLSRLLPARPPVTEPARVRKILFIELSEMGSAIIADPAMRRARARYPQAELFFLIFGQNKASLDLLGTIDPAHVLTIDASGLVPLAKSTLAVLARLRRMKIDMVFDLELFSRFSSLLALLSGAPVRVGFHRFFNEGLYRGDHLTHPVQYNAHQHMGRNFIAMVDAPAQTEGGLPYTKRRIEDHEAELARYELPPARLDAFRQRLLAAFPVLANAKRWVLLNPNASDLMPLRRWPLPSFAELAQRLLEDEEVAILVTGAAGEKAYADHILAATKSPRAIDLTGFTTLAELPVLYTLSTALVTNDSGPAHFAAPARLKTLVLFGPETPALYGAMNENAEFVFKGLNCSPCVSAANHRKSPCSDNQCMKRITVDEVFGPIRRHLDSLTPAATA